MPRTVTRVEKSFGCPHVVAVILMVSAVLLVATTTPTRTAAAETNVITLTQTPCQFLEAENGNDHGFTSRKKADCEAINDRTGDERLKSARVLRLAPGKHIFRVKNKNVPYPLGFWLRGDGLVNRAKLPSVSGGGLLTGATKDYEIDLEPGEYVYSCPLNPTPNYKIVVSG